MHELEMTFKIVDLLYLEYFCKGTEASDEIDVHNLKNPCILNLVLQEIKV